MQKGNRNLGLPWYKFNTPALGTAKEEAGSWPRQSAPAPTRLPATRAVTAARWAFIAPVRLLENDAEASSYPPLFQPPSNRYNVSDYVQFQSESPRHRILRQSVPASHACGFSQVPLSATKECWLGGRVVSLYSH